MNTGDVIQIDAPDFNPDIDEGLPTQKHQEAQGSASITQQSFKKSEERETPALLQRDVEEVDWPDAIYIYIYIYIYISVHTLNTRLSSYCTTII